MTRGGRVDDDWQPATSRPGEIHTVEGEIRQVGQFARRLRGRTDRDREYGRPMFRIGLWFLALAGAVVLATFIVQLLK